ncbi:MAG: malate dehydrogenase, partial [Flavobacteriaceae bacterium]|nr:malate dehydrogenase [Flavobacteriaceae bacterium]
IGVPCVIGRSGLESIVDVHLTAEEQATFNKSAAAVRNMNAALNDVLS